MKPSIGIYIPKWFLASESNKIFAGELARAIKNSGRCEPLLLDLQRLSFSGTKEAKDFVVKNNLVLIVQHDSKFYSGSKRYATNVELLDRFVPFANSTKCQEIGYDKIATKKILREMGSPVLDDKVITSLRDLNNHLVENELYVIKPHHLGAGAGVKLIKKKGNNFLGYQDGRWRNISISERKLKNGTKVMQVKHNFDIKS